MDLLPFSKIAPYLQNPGVLVGFYLLLFFGIASAILKSGLLSRVSRRESSTVLLRILNYGFLLAILLIVLGVAYAGFLDNQRTDVSPKGSTMQQAGDCGSNIVGDNNQAKIDCDRGKTK